MPVSALHGMPRCPNCGLALSYRAMPEQRKGEQYWYCVPCKLEWETGTLCDLIEDEMIPDIEQDGLDAYKKDKEARTWEQIARELAS